MSSSCFRCENRVDRSFHFRRRPRLDAGAAARFPAPILFRTARRARRFSAIRPRATRAFSRARCRQSTGIFRFSFTIRHARRFAGRGRSAGCRKRIAAHHRVRNRVSRWVAARNGYTGYFQLYSVPFSRLPHFDYTEKRDIYLPGGINGGQTHDLRALGKIRACRGHVLTGARATRAMSRRSKTELREGKMRLAYLFTAGLDAAMHAHTTSGAEVDAAFAQFERWLREIHALASARYREVRMHLFSDHGMTDTTAVSAMITDPAAATTDSSRRTANLRRPIQGASPGGGRAGGEETRVGAGRAARLADVIRGHR